MDVIGREKIWGESKNYIKTVELNYCGCGNELRQNNNPIQNILKRHYIIEISDIPDYVICGIDGNNFRRKSTNRKRRKAGLSKKSEFIIASESVVYPGFETEKLIVVFKSHSIPIYYGSDTIRNTLTKNHLSMLMKIISIIWFIRLLNLIKMKKIY